MLWICDNCKAKQTCSKLPPACTTCYAIGGSWKLAKVCDNCIHSWVCKYEGQEPRIIKRLSGKEFNFAMICESYKSEKY